MGWLLGVDLSLSVVAFLALTLFYRTVVPGVLIALTLVRTLAWILDFNRLLAPVRAWQRGRKQRGRKGSDAELLAADAATQRIEGRFLTGYALGWAVVGVLAPLLSLELDTSPAQDVCGLLAGATLVMIVPAFVLPITRKALAELRLDISGDLLERSLSPERRRSPVGRVIGFTFLSLAVTAVVGVGAMVYWSRVEGEHEQARLEALRQAEVDAQKLARGLSLDPGSRVVDADELPGTLELGDDSDSAARFEAERLEAVAAAPVGDGRWVLHRRILDEESWLFALALAVSALLTGVPVSLASSALVRAITAPLEQLDAATRQIAEAGKLRGEARVAVAYNDEVGDLARSFNQMLDVLEELANAATRVAEGDLSLAVEGEGDLQTAFRSMLRRLDDIVLRIRGTALEIASAAAEILAAAQEQEVATEQQSAGLREVGATVGSLGEAANEITKAAGGVLEDAQQTYTSTDAVSRHIDELSRKAQGIGELLDLIAEIAERSDLLALNGSLEAVRAGEAGRGFALVAAEMRRLAERVTGTVTDVSEQVGGIRRATTSTVEATARSRRGAEDTAEASRRISQATERQGRDTKQLVEAVTKLMDVADAATSATTQTRATAEGLRVHADELEQLTREFTLRDDD